jgi:hypothetical protein
VRILAWSWRHPEIWTPYPFSEWRHCKVSQGLSHCVRRDIGRCLMWSKQNCSCSQTTSHEGLRGDKVSRYSRCILDSQPTESNGYEPEENSKRSGDSIKYWNKLRTQQSIFFSARFYCALLTLHVSAPFSGHLQVVRKHKKYIQGSHYIFNGTVE